MAEGMESVDVESETRLRDLAELVWSTREPRVLRLGPKALALVMPLGIKHSKTSEGRADFLRAAGGWKGMDTDRFLAANRKSRDASYRPPVRW